MSLDTVAWVTVKPAVFKMVGTGMMMIGVLVVAFVLLVLLQQLNEKMYPLLFILVLLLILFYFWTTVWRPFVEKLLQLFMSVPYSRQLLMTVSLLVLGEVLYKMMCQYDMESFGFITILAVRIAILAIWLEPVESVSQHFEQMTSLFGR